MKNNIKKKILVVGKTSYIGTTFKSYIDNRYKDNMWIVDLIGASNGEWREKKFEGYDAILHVAAIVHTKETPEKETLYNAVNFELAIAVAQKAKKSGVGQFIFLSTMAVYGKISGIISEATDTKPCTHYGRSKLAAEKALLILNAADFKVAVVRIPMVYGVNCKGNFTRLIKLAAVCPIFPMIRNQRSMIYIENLCEYLHLIVENECQGIGIPQNIETVETTKLFCVIREVQGKRTYTPKCFNGIIYKVVQRIESIGKMFEDCYFLSEQDQGKEGWIKLDKGEYNIVEFENSIEKVFNN